jgi:hypothetical protein
VDHDPGPERLDYRCGKATYDGHDGTDIRVRSLAQAGAVAVVAAAPGVVKAVRDGEPDRLMKSEAERAAVAGKECGNGVIIDHGEDVETQYCHLFRGSVSVRPGETVAAGTRLGAVGYSGAAEFPHVHFEVRREGKSLDPFAPAAPEGACTAGGDPEGFWQASVKDALAYQPARILDFGFAAGRVNLDDVEAGTAIPEPASAQAPAIVAYVRAINVPADARVVIDIVDPGGKVDRDEQKIDRWKAQQFLYAGRKRPPSGWPAGDYTARVTISTASGDVLSTASRTISLAP